MTGYRMEVIFWGVRDIRKINYTPVRRPRIIVECSGVHVKSEVMRNARKFSNFERSHVMIELVIAKNYTRILFLFTQIFFFLNKYIACCFRV